MEEIGIALNLENIIFEHPQRPQQLRRQQQSGPNRLARALGMAKTFLKGLPQGEEDWDNEKSWTQADVDMLHNELVLSKIPHKEHAQIDSTGLLQRFAEGHATSLKGRESQIHTFVFIALGEVAIGPNHPVRAVNATTKKYTVASDSAIRAMRLSVRR